MAADFDMANTGFNLVIERLFISGGTGDATLGNLPAARFNLVIERLFISGTSSDSPETAQQRFQSRNREAFHFRSVPAEPLTHLG